MSTKDKNPFLLIDRITSIARLNDGYIALKTIVPILQAEGYLNCENIDDTKRNLNRVIRTAGIFVNIKIEGKQKSGIWRLKEFVR